jgi:hypothetical protein
VFTSRPTSLLTSIKTSVFFFTISLRSADMETLIGALMQLFIANTKTSLLLSYDGRFCTQGAVYLAETNGLKNQYSQVELLLVKCLVYLSVTKILLIKEDFWRR